MKVEFEPSETIYTLLCHKCGKPDFLIRGLCSECAPALHYGHNITMSAYEEAKKIYEKATGKTPLSDFDEFDKWCEETGIKTPFVKL